MVADRQQPAAPPGPALLRYQAAERLPGFVHEAAPHDDYRRWAGCCPGGCSGPDVHAHVFPLLGRCGHRFFGFATAGCPDCLLFHCRYASPGSAVFAAVAVAESAPPCVFCHRACPGYPGCHAVLWPRHGLVWRVSICDRYCYGWQLALPLPLIRQQSVAGPGCRTGQSVFGQTNRLAVAVAAAVARRAVRLQQASVPRLAAGPEA